MSTPLIPQNPVIVNGDMSLASITSAVTILTNLSLISYSYSWAGSSPIGVVSIQVSNDYAINPDGSVHNAGTWNTLTFSLAGSPVTSAPVTGNTGNGFIDIGPTSAHAIRTVYTKTSGTGHLQVIATAKVT